MDMRVWLPHDAAPWGLHGLLARVDECGHLHAVILGQGQPTPAALQADFGHRWRMSGLSPALGHVLADPQQAVISHVGRSKAAPNPDGYVGLPVTLDLARWCGLASRQPHRDLHRFLGHLLQLQLRSPHAPDPWAPEHARTCPILGPWRASVERGLQAQGEPIDRPVRWTLDAILGNAHPG